MAFIGNTNTTQAFTPAIDYFSGNGSTTAFTLSRPVASVAQVQVVVNNVAQNPSSAYTVSGNTITFTSAPSSGTNNIYVYYTSPITQVTTLTQDPVITGNLNFGSTGARITGDFSNTTSSNRVLFQTSTTNNQTATGLLPNGTSTISQFAVYNGSDPLNASQGRLLSNASEFRIENLAVGTGTYLPMTFYTSGSEKMRIDTSGNVGIGTSSSSSYGSPLSVYAATNPTLAIASGNANAYLRLYSTSDNNMYLTNTGGSMTMITANSERMRIDSSGNVGIGTSTNNVYDNVAAGRPLVVQSSSSATTAGSSTNAITISNSNTTTNNLSQLNFAAVTGANASQFSAAWIACQYGARTNGQYPTGQLIFAVSTALNNAPSEAMRIDNSQNLKFNSGYGSVATAYGCRAWVNFNGTGTVAIRASGNVSSITDNGVGDYTVNFTNAMPDANYSSVASCSPSAGPNQRVVVMNFAGASNTISAPTSSACRFSTSALAATADVEYVHFAAFR